MLGHYENFPDTVHGVTHFTHTTSLKAVQQVIVVALGQLNQKKCSLEEVARSVGPRCEVDFEVGVGEETNFTFLDDSEMERLEREISRKALPLLDFLCVLQYHLIKEPERRSPLKFDYFLLRFAFAKNLTELLVSHERGTQRVHVEDLMRFVIERVRKRLAEDFPVPPRTSDRKEA
ncbi:MAG: hypothetical protein WCC63_05185 [Candidatus Bathyarchaeia archaeon]